MLIANFPDFCIRIKAKHFHQICPSPARHTKIGNVFQTTRFGRGIVDTSCRVIDKCPARSHPFGPKRRKCSVTRSKAVFSPVGAPTQPVGVVPRMGHTTPRSLRTHSVPSCRLPHRALFRQVFRFHTCSVLWITGAKLSRECAEGPHTEASNE